jgi:hypothetical protein
MVDAMTAGHACVCTGVWKVTRPTLVDVVGEDNAGDCWAQHDSPADEPGNLYHDAICEISNHIRGPAFGASDFTDANQLRLGQRAGADHQSGHIGHAEGRYASLDIVSLIGSLNTKILHRVCSVRTILSRLTSSARDLRSADVEKNMCLRVIAYMDVG